jgi:hypothetical protein
MPMLRSLVRSILHPAYFVLGVPKRYEKGNKKACRSRVSPWDKDATSRKTQVLWAKSLPIFSEEERPNCSANGFTPSSFTSVFGMIRKPFAS